MWEMLILSCVQVEATEKSGEVTSPGPPSPRKIWPRASARDQALGAGGGCPALAGLRRQRHIEQDHGPGMESFSAFFGTNLNAISYKPRRKHRALTLLRQSHMRSRAYVKNPAAVCL